MLNFTNRGCLGGCGSATQILGELSGFRFMFSESCGGLITCRPSAAQHQINSRENPCSFAAPCVMRTETSADHGSKAWGTTFRMKRQFYKIRGYLEAPNQPDP